MQPAINPGYQFFVSQVLANHTAHNAFHLVDSVHCAIIVLASKLGYIAVKMFLADFVKCALMSAFKNTPKAFHSVNVDVFINILANTVLD